MTTVANNTTSLPAASGSKTNTPALATTPAGTKPGALAASSSAPIDTVDLSDHAKAVIDKAKADQAATENLTLSFDEILAKRTDALTDRLTKAFTALNVNLDEAVRLQVDKFGHVTTEGPWKAKIEKMFTDDPELAKEFKAVAGLNALKAAQTALDLYSKEKGQTANTKRQDDAWTRYNIRSINIQTLSGVMSLKDGKLRSAAVDYINMLADPHGDGTAAGQKDIANRLA